MTWANIQTLVGWTFFGQNFVRRFVTTMFCSVLTNKLALATAFVAYRLAALLFLLLGSFFLYNFFWWFLNRLYFFSTTTDTVYVSTTLRTSSWSGHGSFLKTIFDGSHFADAHFEDVHAEDSCAGYA